MSSRTNQHEQFGEMQEGSTFPNRVLFGQGQVYEGYLTPQERHNRRIALKYELQNIRNWELHNATIAFKQELYNGRNWEMHNSRIAVQDNVRVNPQHGLVELPLVRSQGEIRPFKPNIFERFENFLYSPTPWYLPITALSKFIGRIAYGTLNSAVIVLQCFTIGHPNARHLSGRGTIGSENIDAGVNVLTSTVPFGRLNVLRQSGPGVMNAAQFNSYHKGMRINSATDGGALIRRHNNLERFFIDDIPQFKSTYNTFKRATSVVKQIHSDLKDDVE